MRIRLKYKTVVTIAVSCVVLASLLFYFTFFSSDSGKPAFSESRPGSEVSEEGIVYESDSSPQGQAMPTETPDEQNPEILVPGKLTNLPVTEETLIRRPIAVVINNMYAAHPQSGIANADIIYEVLAEGEITRLVGIFQDYEEIPKLGPVRSARDYFVDFALDYDAIFIHHGGSPTGYAKLRNLHVDRLDGMTYEGSYFRRDRTYPSWHNRAGTTRPLVHSSYTDGEQIKAAAETLGFRTGLYEDRPFGFLFYEGEVPTHLARGEASSVSVPFSKDYTRKFIYNPDTKLYSVENRDGPHRDAEQGDELAVRNVIIQLADSYVIAGDEEGRRYVGTVGSGSGYLATDGVYRPINWRKHSAETPTEWTFADGSEMRLGTGKSWICVYGNAKSEDFF